ncbi:hypothetical protein V6N13_098273 [Hibiscus sabdariffa]
MVWYARNKMVYEGTVPSIAHTLSFVVAFLREDDMRHSQICRRPPRIQGQWLAPAPNAEVLACLVAVNFARDLGFTRVVIEGDSLTVIKKCQSENIDASLISPLIVDIKEVSKVFVSVSYGFVHREANGAAHVLAQEGKMYSSPMYWMEETPPNTTLAADKDRERL